MINRALILLGIIAFAFCYVPPPPQASAQFSGQAQFASSPSTGSANAQSVALANYSLQVGVPITFTVGAGLGNTAALTLNINGTGAINVKRNTNVGVFDFVGGEFVAANTVTVLYDGTQYRQANIVYQVGVVAIFRGSVDPGWQIEDGACLGTLLSRNQALFAKLGNQYGSCGANLFNVADTRGRIDAGLDNQGANGAASRITNCAFTSQGVGCGGQNSALTSVNQMPPYTPGGTTTFTPSGSISFPITAFAGQAAGSLDTGGTGAPVNPNQLTAANVIFTGNQISPALAGTAVGASSPFATLSPVFSGIRAVKL